MYQIEKGIPLPPRSRSSGYSKYPFADMQLGDSFVISLNPGESIDQLRFRANSALAKARKTTNAQFSSRTVDGGIRIWRTA